MRSSAKELLDDGKNRPALAAAAVVKRLS